ncbi:MAG TPA: hypothetical protein VK843_16385 [Planctomycetota bacterium]|nr:hypothetical protein [Planctomycetota bacterium]
MSGASATTDEQGWFSIEGLEPGLHEISLRLGSPGLIVGARWPIQASADGVRLAVDFGRLVVHVQCDGKPAKAAVLLSEGVGKSVWGTNPAPTHEMFLPPGKSCSVVVLGPEGYLDQTLDIVAPAAGQTTDVPVELVREERSAGLVIDLVASDGTVMTDAGFAFFLADEASSPTRTFRMLLKSRHVIHHGFMGGFPDFFRDMRRGHDASQGEGGVFRLTELPAGKYRVEVQPESTGHGGDIYWVCTPIEVELLAGAIVRRQMDVARGGRLRIQALNARGEPLGADCRLFDSTGRELPLAWHTEAHGSTWNGQKGKLNASVPEGSNEAEYPFLPGTYELRLSMDDYVEATRPVVIEAGKMTFVSVVLEQR